MRTIYSLYIYRNHAYNVPFLGFPYLAVGAIFWNLCLAYLEEYIDVASALFWALVVIIAIFSNVYILVTYYL